MYFNSPCEKDSGSIANDDISSRENILYNDVYSDDDLWSSHGIFKTNEEFKESIAYIKYFEVNEKWNYSLSISQGLSFQGEAFGDVVFKEVDGRSRVVTPTISLSNSLVLAGLTLKDLIAQVWTCQ